MVSQYLKAFQTMVSQMLVAMKSEMSESRPSLLEQHNQQQLLVQ